MQTCDPEGFTFINPYYQVVILVAWEGVPDDTATDIYDTLAATLPYDGVPTMRQCDKNQR